jgi:hypothetical protein
LSFKKTNVAAMNKIISYKGTKRVEEKSTVSEKKVKKASDLKIINQELKKEIRVLKQQVKRLEASRLSWKTKAIESKKGSKSVEIHAKRHHYSTLVVWLVVQLQTYGLTSLRCCAKLIQHWSLIFGLKSRRPSASTIRNWVIKVGYYRTQTLFEDPNTEWVLWIDESILLGQDKILLILGSKVGTLDFKTALSHASVEVVYIGVNTSWTSPQIHSIWSDLGTRLKIHYIVSDEGNNLKATYQLGDRVHIPDCSHVFANGFASIYAALSEYQEWSQKCNLLRKKWVLGKNSVYCPPAQRSKARFMNVARIVEWASNCIRIWAQIPAEIQVELAFLKEHQAWILEFQELQQTSQALLNHLKTNGFRSEKKAKMIAFLGQLTTTRQKKWSEFIQKYLDLLDTRCLALGVETICCCSDIIESTFGKFKSKVNTKNPQAMTSFVYCMANFGGKLSQESIKNALENVKVKEISALIQSSAPSRKAQKEALFGKKVKPKMVDF